MTDTKLMTDHKEIREWAAGLSGVPVIIDPAELIGSNVSVLLSNLVGRPTRMTMIKERIAPRILEGRVWLSGKNGLPFSMPKGWP